MMTKSGAPSLPTGQQRQPPPPPSSSGGNKKAAASPSRQQPGDKELATPGATSTSDLAPSANTFIRKLYQMVTTEDQDVIAFTPGASRR